MNDTQFSVVIPLFNKASSIRRTLASVQGQRVQPAEIIVVDDGSTDGSADVVEQLNIPNLRLIKQSNQGVSVARNNGVERAKHQHIAFIDADDEWSCFYLHEMNKLIHRFPLHGAYAAKYQKVMTAGTFIDPKISMSAISPTGGVLKDYFAIGAQGDLPFMPSSLVITKDLFKRVGGFPAGEPMGEDQALFCQVALHTQIIYSPLVLMFYHIDSENRACDRHLPSEPLPFAKRLLTQLGNDQKSNYVIRKYCAAHICHLIKLNLRAKRVTVAGELLAHSACKYKPLHKCFYTCWWGVLTLLDRVSSLSKLNPLAVNSSTK